MELKKTKDGHWVSKAKLFKGKYEAKHFSCVALPVYVLFRLGSDSYANFDEFDSPLAY